MSIPGDRPKASDILPGNGSTIQSSPNRAATHINHGGQSSRDRSFTTKQQTNKAAIQAKPAHTQEGPTGGIHTDGL